MASGGTRGIGRPPGVEWVRLLYTSPWRRHSWRRSALRSSAPAPLPRTRRMRPRHYSQRTGQEGGAEHVQARAQVGVESMLGIAQEAACWASRGRRGARKSRHRVQGCHCYLWALWRLEIIGADGAAETPQPAGWPLKVPGEAIMVTAQLGRPLRKKPRGLCVYVAETASGSA